MPDRRPAPDEYAPHHETYIALVALPVMDTLRAQRAEVLRLADVVTEEGAGFRYAEGKWTIRECVGHLSDAERIYNFRALAFARNDPAPLPRYDPDAYVEHADFESRTMRQLVDEFLAVREGTLALFGSFAPEVWSRAGTMGGARVTVRGQAWIAAGHVARHLNVLYERYGVAKAP